MLQASMTAQLHQDIHDLKRDEAAKIQALFAAFPVQMFLDKSHVLQLLFSFSISVRASSGEDRTSAGCNCTTS